MIQQTNKYINKALSMEIIKNKIQIQLSKTDMSNIIAEALLDEAANASIKRILNPFLANSFPQFCEHTNVTLGETAEDGSTVVTLSIPRQTVDTPIKSIEPLVVNTTAAPEYVEPSTDAE